MRADFIKRKVFFIVVLISLCYAAHGAVGFKDLTLEISTKTPVVLPMEPLAITISLSNNTDSSISAYPVINPGSGCLKIFVRKEGGEFELFQTADWWTVSDVWRKIPELIPGYKVQEKGFLYFAKPSDWIEFNTENFFKQHLLPEPGVYEIIVRFKNLWDQESQEEIESDIMTVKVVEPENEDALAYEYMKKTCKPYFLLQQFGAASGPRSEPFFSAQKDFLLQFPNSGYIRYTKYSLGRTYILKSYSNGTYNDRDDGYLDTGMSLLEEVAGDKDFFFAGTALNLLSNVLASRGELEKAEEYKAQLQELQDSELAQDEQVAPRAEEQAVDSNGKFVVAGIVAIVVFGVGFFVRSKFRQNKAAVLLKNSSDGKF